MLCEVLALANEHVALPASEGTCSLSDSVRDMAAYSKLTDSVFKYIELRTDVDELGPGEIAAVSGIDVEAGATLTDGKLPYTLHAT